MAGGGVALGALLAAVVAAGGCSLTSAGEEAPRRADAAPERGGKLTVLSATDIDTIDPGGTGLAAVLGMLEPAHRGLYGTDPAKGLTLQPDLAEGPPRIGDGGRTIAIRIRPGVRYSPPIGREVVAGDVEYGIERMFSGPVASPWVPLLSDVLGARAATGKAVRDMAGVEAPNDRTLVIRLTRPSAESLVPLLAMPGASIGVPVPRELGRRHDKPPRSSYDSHQAATGPYMIKAASNGRIGRNGFDPGKALHLVRNPNWDPKTDFRPAYLDEIEVQLGNDDIPIAARRIFAGRSLAGAALAVPPGVLRQLKSADRKDLFSFGPSDKEIFLTFNTQRAPFDDVNVRRAAYAAIDREAVKNSLGGDFFGSTASHFIPPALDGFEESGGRAGPDFAWARATSGNLDAAGELLRRAGYENRRFDGSSVTFLARSDYAAAAEILQGSLERLGLRVRLRVITPGTLYSQCGSPRSVVEICLGGWSFGTYDSGQLFQAVFHSQSLEELASLNYSRLRSKEVDRLIERAETTVGKDDRARAWATVNRAVVESAAAVPLVWPRRPIAHSRDVEGPAVVDLAYPFVWLRR